MKQQFPVPSSRLNSSECNKLCGPLRRCVFVVYDRENPCSNDKATIQSLAKWGTGSRERGTGNGEQGTGNRKRGTKPFGFS